MEKEQATTETIFFDESGTPATKVEGGPFIVGGFSTRGDTKPILEDWEDFITIHHLEAKKGRKYSDAEFLDLSEFMCKKGIMPVASHSRLDEADRRVLIKKIEKYHEIGEQINPNRLVIRASSYLWTLQAAITIATSVLSIVAHRGKTTKVRISVDKYLRGRELQSIIERVVRNFFEPARFNAFLKPVEAKFRGDLSLLRLQHNFTPECEFIATDWNARGRFKQLADAVCAMYRKSLTGDAGAQAAWHVIKLCYQEDGETPKCIGNEVTGSLKTIIRRDWSLENI